MPTPPVRTLQRALETLGSPGRLALALEISLEELHAFLDEKEAVPYTVFIDALEIVAVGRT